MLQSPPPEVLDLIFSELSPADLRNTRLVCRSFTFVAAQHLFSEVFVSPNQECLQNLECIASHSTFRQHVRSVIYSEQVLPFYRDFEEWLSHVDSTAEALDHLENYYDAYVLRIKYQATLQADGVLKSKLTRALALMPNISNVTVNTELELCPITQDRASVLRIARETLCRPWHCSKSNSEYPWHVRNLLESLHDSGTQIRLLQGYWLNLMELNHPSSPFKYLGQQLRHLTLQSRYHRESRTYGVVGIQQILTEALLLETLELSFDVSIHAYAKVNFSQLWAKAVHYRSLKQLTLAGVRTSQPSLKEFLTLHAPTLRSLKLDEVGFECKNPRDENGLWKDTIYFIERHMNLTAVNLRMNPQGLAPGEIYTTLLII